MYSLADETEKVEEWGVGRVVREKMEEGKLLTDQ